VSFKRFRKNSVQARSFRLGLGVETRSFAAFILQLALPIHGTQLYRTNVNETPDAPVTEEGAKDVKIKWLINKKDGAPTFLMRHFTVKAGGFTPFHSHNWEHEVYVLEGSGTVRYENREEKIAPGDAILIPPNARHQFRAGSEKPLEFLCMIPK
jgi:quercetin dioxygenase-like cupin family protein